MQADAHDVFPHIREREAVRSIIVPVDAHVEIMEKATETEEPKSPKSSFVAVSSDFESLH